MSSVPTESAPVTRHPKSVLRTLHLAGRLLQQASLRRVWSAVCCVSAQKTKQQPRAGLWDAGTKHRPSTYRLCGRREGHEREKSRCLHGLCRSVLCATTAPRLRRDADLNLACRVEG